MLTKYLSKRNKKKIRIRKKVSGTAVRPRISVFRSLSQIYAQLINDETGQTLCAASSLTKELAADIKKSKSKIETAAIVGEYLGKKAKELGIEKAVFDRAGFVYHGRVKALAEGIRKGGLTI